MSFDKKKVSCTLKTERYIMTTDNWHCNFPNNTVKIILFLSIHYKFVRISVWGNDDFGLELTYQGNYTNLFDKYNEMKYIFNNIPEPCTQEYFLSLGFIRA